MIVPSVIHPVICPAVSAEEVAAVRALFRAYGSHLAGRADICIENFAAEIASLPGAYLLLLLAKVEDQPAGCVALKRLGRVGERACELKRLWVDPAFRGSGLGKKLVEEAIAQAVARGHTALYLDTVPVAMPEANRLYETMGFERIERYNTNPVPDITFLRLMLA